MGSIIFSVRFQAKKNVISSEQFHHPTGKSSKEAHSIPLAHINIVCVTDHSPDLYLTQGGGVDFLHHMLWSFCVQSVQFSICSFCWYFVELLTFLLFKLFNVNPNNQIKHLTLLLVQWGGLRGRDRLVVGFTTTYAISAYHHWCCELESRSWRGVQHYEIKFVSNLRLTTILMTHLLNHVIHTSFFK